MCVFLTQRMQKEEKRDKQTGNWYRGSRAMVNTDWTRRTGRFLEYPESGIGILKNRAETYKLVSNWCEICRFFLQNLDSGSTRNHEDSSTIAALPPAVALFPVCGQPRSAEPKRRKRGPRNFYKGSGLRGRVLIPCVRSEQQTWDAQMRAWQYRLRNGAMISPRVFTKWSFKIIDMLSLIRGESPKTCHAQARGPM